MRARARQQPPYIKLFNRLARPLEQAGWRWPSLKPADLVKAAERQTGLRNFGEPDYAQGLKLLTDELQEQAQLTQIGRLAARFNLIENLCTRLQLVDYRARHPSIAQEQIKRPLFITGLPRTGTTILFELIAQDPAMRSPASWEVAKPIPPARRDSYLCDPRIKSVDRFMGLAEKLSPGFQAIHAIGATLPQECVYIFASQFTSEQFGYMFNIPRYRDWVLSQDMTQTYRWHAHFLQHLQSEYTGERWVLKTPSHIAYLEYLLAQYPDAAIVWTHRQPLDAMASFSSLAANLQGAFCDTVDPQHTGAQEFQHFARMVETGMAQRERLGETHFFDVGFNDICADPIAVIRALYDRFCIPFSREAESRMNQYLKTHPRYTYGRHHYAAADFGLDGTQEQAGYASYLNRFGKYLQ